ncbi:MAG TPA: DUF948 domain-containing protein [Vicinamibacterales bacterium]|nr:DUF948 domain-containing protein [Vicinamibacterales bacterium]
MSDWPVVFLGIIAIATLVMAVVQIGAIIATLKIAREMQKVARDMHKVGMTLQQDVRPVFAKVNAMADEASRTLALASAQVEKVDRLVTDLTRRVDETAIVVQKAITTPAREGMAIVAAIKASLGALRGFRDYRGRPAGRSEDEESLFIG